MSDAIEGMLQAMVRTATPLAYAALGELLVERAGIVNIGLEGVVLAGAFGALVGATSAGADAGFLAGAAAGFAMAMIFAAFVVGARANQIVVGTAITLLALGITGSLYRELYGLEGAALSAPTVGPVALAPLDRFPLVGQALFAQPAPTWALYGLVPFIWWWLTRTHAGLGLRAVGEHPEAAAAAGIHPRRVQVAALAAAGALGGIGGATLVLAQAGTFAEGMSAGRGFIAIAIVALGRWHPGGVALAALAFGGATALQYLVQTGSTSGARLPYQLVLALPYLLTLAALAAVRARSGAPAALGRDSA